MTSHERATALARLATPSGSALFEMLATLPDDRLLRITRARAITDSITATVAVELLELRRRAASKFPESDRLWFTPEGLEQSTGRPIAAYRASRFNPNSPVIELCCGIGGDAMSLAARGPTVAVDLDPAAIWCAYANTVELGVSEQIRCLNADVTRLDFTRLKYRGIRQALFDPSRRHSDNYGQRHRASHPEDYSPPLSWAMTLRDQIPNVAIKLSPAATDDTLRACDARIEFVSQRGECKEAIAWLGDLAGHLPLTSSEPYHATVIARDGSAHTLSHFNCGEPPAADPRGWLLEPDPAVIRAHLIAEFVTVADSAVLEPGIAYLTADVDPKSPFATAYRILDWLPRNEKEIRASLRRLGRRAEVVKRRGVEIEPESLRKQLRYDDEPPSGAVIILMPFRGRTMAAICEPVDRNH